VASIKTLPNSRGKSRPDIRRRRRKFFSNALRTNPPVNHKPNENPGKALKLKKKEAHFQRKKKKKVSHQRKKERAPRAGEAARASNQGMDANGTNSRGIARVKKNTRTIQGKGRKHKEGTGFNPFRGYGADAQNSA